jgi:hypothetical protein
MLLKTKTYFFALTLCLLPFFAFGNSQYAPSSRPHQIIVNNKVLAKINGKPISLVDVVKKLEMVFYQQYPDYAHSSEAKYEFFTNSWQHVLSDMINAELILADAEQKKLEANDGEIHQQLEQNFGPSVIENLEKANLNFEDAFQMTRRELTASKMLDMLQFKAIQKVTPNELKETYNKHFTHLKPITIFHYQVLSFSGENSDLNKESSNLARNYLQKEAATPEKVKEKLLKAKRYENQVKIEVSSLIQTEEEKLSKSYQEILSPLAENQPSNVLENSNSKQPYRLFFLSQKEIQTPPTFKDVEKNLNDAVFQEKLAGEQQKYLKSLRDNFAISDAEVLDLPDNYQPFSYQ